MKAVPSPCFCGPGKNYPAEGCNIGTRYGASNQIRPKPTISLAGATKKADQLKPELKLA
jgi:hypothetical protein